MAEKAEKMAEKMAKSAGESAMAQVEEIRADVARAREAMEAVRYHQLTERGEIPLLNYRIRGFG